MTRRVAASSILKWGNIAEGTRFDPLITQFHYKDDFLHDYILDNDFIDHIIGDKGSQEFAMMCETNEKVFVLLEKAFAQFKMRLIDFKLEMALSMEKFC